MNVNDIHIAPIPLIVSVVAVYIAGEFVGKFINRYTEELRVVEDKVKWAMFDAGGRAVGRLERLLFYFALLVGYPAFVGAWLIFKVASKWDTWSHIIMLPRLDIEDLSDPRFEDRQRFGTWLLSRFLLGVLANIAIAVIGVWLYVEIQRLWFN